jgi:hypothetical protein
MRFGFHRKTTAKVAINLKPVRRAWGGANQWTAQVSRWLEYQGWSVSYDLSSRVDAVIMTHTGMVPMTTFGWKEVGEARKKWPEMMCVHRINDNDIRKETTLMDDFLSENNQVADHTVFVSSWLRDYHAARWFDHSKPHSVILPGADTRVFHPIGNQPWQPGTPFRLVTHHWSDNWNKGFDLYRDIDELIDSGKCPGFELWIVGRWPHGLEWKAATTVPPNSGPALAEILRSCHGYVSASRHEPGAMHVAEGLQCGLPLLFHPDTGGTPEMVGPRGMGLSNDLEGSLLTFRNDYPLMRKHLLESLPSGARMASHYEMILLQLIS